MASYHKVSTGWYKISVARNGVARGFLAVLCTVMRDVRERVTRPLLRAWRDGARGKMPEILKEVLSTEKYLMKF